MRGSQETSRWVWGTGLNAILTRFWSVVQTSASSAQEVSYGEVQRQTLRCAGKEFTGGGPSGDPVRQKGKPGPGEMPSKPWLQESLALPDGLWELSVGVAPQGVLPRSKGVGLLQPTQSLATTTPAGGRAHIAFQVSLAEAGPEHRAAVRPSRQRGPLLVFKGMGLGEACSSICSTGPPTDECVGSQTGCLWLW